MIGTAINNSITKNWLDSLECGTIIPWGSNGSIPPNTLICNGANVSRTTYSNLFSKIGTAYGSGDGSTTFQLPDLNGRFLEGSNGNVSYVSAGVPNITGTADVTQGASYDYNATGCFYKTTNGNGGNWDTGANCKFNFNASRSSSLYGASSTIQPKSLRLKFLIKY